MSLQVVFGGSRDFMDQNMNKTNHMLNYLYPVVGRASLLLQDFMIK